MGNQTSNYVKLELLKGNIDFDGHTFRLLLVRSGFVFDPACYGKKINLEASSGSISITFSNTSKTIHRTVGSFIDDGFVVGNRITTTSSNNPGPFTVTDVTATDLTCSAATFVNESVSKVIMAIDELANGNGYVTGGGAALSGVSVDQDDEDDRASVTWSPKTWTADGGTIGPTPGAILIDDSHSDDVIIGYLDFGSEQQVQDTGTFTVSGIEVDLN